MCNCFFYDVCLLRVWVELLNECEQRLITVKGSFFIHTIIITGVKVIEVPTVVFDIHATLQVKNLCLCFWRELNTGEVSNYIVVKSFCHTICFWVLDYYNMVAFGQKFKNRPNFYERLTFRGFIALISGQEGLFQSKEVAIVCHMFISATYPQECVPGCRKAI